MVTSVIVILLLLIIDYQWRSSVVRESCHVVQPRVPGILQGHRRDPSTRDCVTSGIQWLAYMLILVPCTEQEFDFILRIEDSIQQYDQGSSIIFNKYPR